MKIRRPWVHLFSVVGVALVAGLLFPANPRDLFRLLPLPASTPPKSISILLPAHLGEDAALLLAAGELSRALEASGHSASLSAEEVEGLAPFTVVVRERDNPWVERLVEERVLSLPNLGEEGYLVQKVGYRGTPLIVVVGGGILGQAYGLLKLAERLRLDPQALSDQLYIRAEPMMTLRILSSPGIPDYPSPQEVLRWGFNAVMVEPWPGLALYRDYQTIFDPQERAWVEANRQRALQQIEAAKRLHLKVVSSGDVFHLPRRALSLYREQVAADDNPTVFCIGKAKTQELLAAGLREVLTDFPQIDAIMARTGENYPLGPLAGNSPAQGQCSGLSYPQRVQRIIEVAYRQVVEAQGKTYIHRAWDLWDSGVHANPEVARAVFQGMESKKGLLVSFKQTQTDFWRHNAVNPNIGALPVQQMVEFQMAREYEGKGAFPNYLGGILARGGPEASPQGGMDYAYQKGVRAIWVWARGGGWGGPQPASTLWVEANLYAAGRLAWDTGLSPEALAWEWAALRFGTQAAPAVTRLLMKSDDATLQAFYIGPAAKYLGPWTPHNLWVRDDLIFGEPKMEELYRILRREGDFRAALEEKDQALQLVESMMADAEAARPFIEDQGLAEEVVNSLRYEKALVETLTYYLGGMLYYHRWKEGGRRDDQARREALTRLQEWARVWQYYEREIPRLKGTASLFRDGGMGKAAREAFMEMEEAR